MRSLKRLFGSKIVVKVEAPSNKTNSIVHADSNKTTGLLVTDFVIDRGFSKDTPFACEEVEPGVYKLYY